MIAIIHKRRQGRQGKRLALLLSVSYLLFAIAPFLLIHSHIKAGEGDHQGSHVETTHAHAWDFWAHGNHEDEEATGHEQDQEGEDHSSFHLEEFAGDHEGMDSSPRSLISTSFSWVYFPAAVVLYLEDQLHFPVSGLGYVPGRIPILSEPVSQRISSCLHGDLPPPSVA